MRYRSQFETEAMEEASHNISDYIDGRLYKKMKHRGCFSHPMGIAISISLDGLEPKRGKCGNVADSRVPAKLTTP